MLSVNQEFSLWVFGWPLLGIAAGLIGLRFGRFRQALVWPAAVYSLALFGYGLFRGGPNECVENAAGNGYTCHPTSLFSDLDTAGVIIVVAMTLLSLSPLLAWRMRVRTPSVAAAGAMVLLTILFIVGLLAWIPASSAVVAAAIAGPPEKEGGAPDAGAPRNG